MSPQNPDWLANAVFYQIYPQSFLDTNRDGIGDLPGIIAKLDYIQSLGCNAIWINPCFESPFLDAGYDVADYYRVAPRYGTNADLKRLFQAAKKRGIRVCLDLVAGHTSIQCQWFQQSARHTNNNFSDWYIWTNDWLQSPGMTNGQPLNGINGYSARNGCYITNFFWSQPALNYGFTKPDPKQPWQQSCTAPGPRAVRGEMKKIIRYWLDQGACGFRVDMASSLVKGDTGWKKTSLFWQEVRAMLDRDYPQAVLIAEWSFPRAAIKAGFHMDLLLHSHLDGYNALFRQEAGTNVIPIQGRSYFRKAGQGDAAVFIKEYLDHYRKIKNRGYISIPTGNHDLPRIAFHRSPRELELIFAFTLTMPGIPLIYYGDEIGMKYLPDLPSHEGGYNRTGSRTPMQWNAQKNAGFSAAAAAKLYLPIDPDPSAPNVADQEKSPQSLLNQVRRLIRLRHTYPALAADGRFTPLYVKPHAYPLIYQRQLGRDRFVIALNPAARPCQSSCRVQLSAAPPQTLIAARAACRHQKQKLAFDMKGVSYIIVKL